MSPVTACSPCESCCSAETAHEFADRRCDASIIKCPSQGRANATLDEARYERLRLLDSRIHAMSGRWLLHGFFYLKVSWIAWPKLA